MKLDENLNKTQRISLVTEGLTLDIDKKNREMENLQKVKKSIQQKCEHQFIIELGKVIPFSRNDEVCHLYACLRCGLIHNEVSEIKKFDSIYGEHNNRIIFDASNYKKDQYSNIFNDELEQLKKLKEVRKIIYDELSLKKDWSKEAIVAGVNNHLRLNLTK